ncbi:SUZ domain containing protein 1 [Dissostichus eleginoides]|uniref:SUZ RNA-binding domain-containing n=1 Tax=Dissostichus eleginoides TaxID=100907 RepID=A0AAD9CAN0_DISEL|nr:SUZ domain containing protein 1 [Dissostichus eleginoides]
MDEVDESWEEAADSGEMEKRLEEKLRISQKEKETTNNSLRSPLKTAMNRPTPQVKSLAQREAEYAEARKRILGSACPDETPQDKPNTDKAGRNNSTLPSEDTRSNNHTVRQPASPDGTQGFRQHR